MRAGTGKVTWAMMPSGPFVSARFPAFISLVWGVLVWSNWLFFNPLPAAQVKAAFRAYTRVDWRAALEAAPVHVLWAAGLLFLSLAAMGTGRPAAAFLRQRGKAAGSILNCALGAGVLSLAVLGLGFVGLAFSGPAWALTACGAFFGFLRIFYLGLRKTERRKVDPEWRSAKTILLAAGMAAAVFIAFTGALAPARAYDALFHHLAHPQIFSENHKVIGLTHHYLSYYPALLEMQYLLAMLLGGGLEFAKLVHFLWGILVLGMLFRWARESLSVSWSLAAVLGFCLLPYVQLVMMWGYVDLGAAAYLTLAVWLASGKRIRPAALGAICGLCVGTKAGGLFAAVLTGALLAIRGANRRILAVFAAAFFLVALPWGVRNWAVSGNPFAPFLSGIFPTLDFGAGNMARYRSELTSYTGREVLPGGALSFLALPWNASIRNLGVLDKQGGMSGWFIFALPCLLLFPSRAARLPAFLCGGYFLLWLAIPRQVRYLLPIWPVAAIAAAHAVRQMAKRGGLADLAVGGAGVVLFVQLLAAVHRQYYTADPLKAAFGAETREEYLERGIGGRPYSIWAMKWLRENLPRERVLIVSEFALGALWGPKAVFQSAFDTPLVEKFARECFEPEGINKKFRQRKIGHILYGTASGFSMQREYRIFNFDEGSAGRWRKYWTNCAKPVYNQNDRYILFALECGRARKVSSLPGIDEQALADIEAESRELGGAGRLPEALPRLSEEYMRIAVQWDSPRAFELLGWTMLEGGRISAGRSALDQAERMGRDSVFIHYGKGLLCMQDGDLAGAIRRFERCLELDPTMYEARTKMAEILTQLGRHEQARKVIKDGQYSGAGGNAPGQADRRAGQGP